MCMKHSLILHKIAVVTLIILNAFIDTYEICENSKSIIKSTESYHFPVRIISFITNGLQICFSMAAIYAIITEKLYILLAFLVAIVVYCFTKMVVWVVCGNYLDKVDPFFDHRLFQLGFVSALLSLCFSSLLWMRLDELHRE